MIGSLRGELTENRPGQIMVDVNGVGYIVYVSESTREDLPSIGNEIKIYTYMAVREDAISLYGFITKDQQDMFLKLITVSGVGPKNALVLLSVFSVLDLKYAILSEDSAKISKAPGVGKKTAERIIIDLKDKIDKNELIGVKPENTESIEKTDLSGEAKDALEALVALGYDKKSATKAISMIDDLDGKKSNEILRLALLNIF